MLQPAEEHLMFLTAREDRRHRAVGRFPRAAGRPLLRLGRIRQRVTRMPTDSYYTATLMVGDDLAANQVEGNRIKVLFIPHLYAAQLKTHDSRVIATGLQHIAAVWLVGPTDAIERIILMTEHTPLLLQYAQTMHELLTRQGLRFMTRRKNKSEKDNQKGDTGYVFHAI